MTDISVQDECYIEMVIPAKKKLKQAQLPFLSSLESPNSVANKKRKLTSPSIECRKPKVIKVKDVEENESKKNLNNGADDNSEDVEVVEKTENEDEQEHVTTDEIEDVSKTTPKRRSIGKKKEKKKKDTANNSGLENFLKKSTAEEDKEESTNSPSPTAKCTSVSPKGNDSVRLDPDSETELQSSDIENKDVSKKANDNLKRSIENCSPKTPKTPRLEKNVENVGSGKKLTPTQQKRKLLNAKKKEEKERLRMEKEKKLEEERENKLKEKEERRREKEEKEKAEREQKMKEKKQKEMKKQMEIEQKQKEKEVKEEERRKKEEAKEEEKRKKEEEKLEAERKKQKAASNFASFFFAKKQESKSNEEEDIVEAKNFMPFEVKADMRVAPVCRRILSKNEKSTFENACSTGTTKKSNLYVTEIRSKNIVPRKSTKTWPIELKDDVQLIDEEIDGGSKIMDQSVVVEKRRAKLLQFVENRRPPYWGTWRKRSQNINSRRPFSRDTKWFNYEVDSDEEWEEEEPGESLCGSDDEKDEENPEDNEYDVDNDFMVPHGYLSDEEALADEEEEDMSPETQKFKLKVLGEQFESDRKTQTSKLKPQIVGCVWQRAGNKFPENVPAKTAEFLSALEVWVGGIPVTLPSKEVESAASGECGTPTHQAATPGAKKTKVPSDALPEFIRLVHGNLHGRAFLVKEFLAHWNKRNAGGENKISKTSLMKKIREIATWMACPDEGPMHLKTCWYVPEVTRKQYLPADEELTLPNRWSYILTPTRRSDFLDAVDKAEKEEKDKERKSVPLITQFTKKITQEEMKKQLTVKPGGSASPEQRAPKRATLISVGRGEQFSKTSRDNLLKNSVVAGKTPSNDSEKIVAKGNNEERDSDIEVVSVSTETKENNDKLSMVPSVDSGSVKTKDRKKSTPKRGKSFSKKLKFNTPTRK